MHPLWPISGHAGGFPSLCAGMRSQSKDMKPLRARHSSCRVRASREEEWEMEARWWEEGENVAESTVLISSVILRTPFPPPQAGGYYSSWLHLYIAINLWSMTTLQTNQYAFNIHPLPCVAITLLPPHKWSYNAVVWWIELWGQFPDLIMNWAGGENMCGGGVGRENEQWETSTLSDHIWTSCYSSPAWQ